MAQIEKKMLKYDVLKIQNNEFGKIRGYASVLGVTDIQDDIIVRGAFGLIENPKAVKMLWSHSEYMQIGQWKEIREDGYGLIVDGIINLNTRNGKEVYTMIDNNPSNCGLSIGYIVEDSYYKNSIRHITKLKLIEISIVFFPANSLTSIRSRGKEQKEWYQVDLYNNTIQALRGITDLTDKWRGFFNDRSLH